MRAGAVVVVGAAVLAGAPPNALAQAPPTYAGGLLPAGRTARAPVGIVLQPRGERLALRFESAVRCGNAAVPVTARRVVAFDGTHVAAAGSGRARAGGRRLAYSWTLGGALAEDGATGTLHVAIRGSRPCARGAELPWQARLVGAPAGAAAAPAPGATLLGATARAVAGRLPGAVVVRVTRDGRHAAALWTAAAPCGRGRRVVVAHRTAPRPVRGAALTATERFSLRSGGTLVRYRAAFAARFTTGGATGSVRVRARVLDGGGRRVRTRCDSGTLRWTALAAPAPATPPAPPTPPAPAPPLDVPPGQWALRITSDPGDSIGLGATFAIGPATHTVSLGGGPAFVNFTIENPSMGGDFWLGDFAAPPGQTLAVGSYPGALRYRFSDGAPGLEVDGQGRGCNTLTGAFTIDAIAFDPGGALRTFIVRFEQHCEGGPAALRGAFAFRAA